MNEREAELAALRDLTADLMKAEKGELLGFNLSPCDVTGQPVLNMYIQRPDEERARPFPIAAFDTLAEGEEALRAVSSILGKGVGKG